MSSVIMEKGGYSVTACTSQCDGCGEVRPAAQYTGRNGYAVICDRCNVEMLTDMARRALNEAEPAPGFSA